MSKYSRLALALLVLAAGAAAAWFARPQPGSDTPPVDTVRLTPFDLAALGADDPKARFSAAVEVANSDDAAFDERFEETLRQAGGSGLARDALEFVRWKRSGQPLPERSNVIGARPNVLLVSIDTLRADHLGCYGYPRETSPNLDALAKRGVVFENAFSTAPWTLPGHMSIFTSLYPSFHKLESRRRRLDPAVRTLPKSIKDLGYQTAAFVTHPFLAKDWGFGTGFDLYFRHPRIVPAERQTSTVIDWLDWQLYHQRRAGESEEFFLFVHYMDPHEEYAAPEPFGSKYTGNYEGELSPTDHLVTMFLERDFPSQADYEYAVGLYDGEISYVDHEVGRLFDHLQERGLLDSMVVVVTSDHGEEFKDHGSMGHASSVHREQLHVPLIIVAPSSFAPGTRIASQASLVDVYPTLAGLLGASVPAQAQGVDLRSLGTNGRSQPQYAELGPLGEKWSPNLHKRSIRTDRYRLIVDFDQGAKSLFDVQRDPEEQIDLYPALHNRRSVRALQRKLQSFTKAGATYLPDSQKQPSIELDDKTKQQLRALGYIE